MQEQKHKSGSQFDDPLSHLRLDESITTKFTGYDELETESNITALIHNNNSVQSVSAGEGCWVITDKSPFFIVGGGQVPDHGWLLMQTIKVPIQEVRFIGNAIATQVITPVTIHVGDTIRSDVDATRRNDAMKNHTATHLLQAALIQLLGKQVKQSGSFVHPDYLRFDFTYHKSLTGDEIKKIEDWVNKKIRNNIPISITYTTLKDARTRGALAFFGDKYNPEDVRLVEVGDFSAELCGGTHVNATGEIGTFKIIEVTALSAGHRRIVAVTGPRALKLFQETFKIIKQLRQEFKVTDEHILESVNKQKEQLKKEQLKTKQFKKQVLHYLIPTWMNRIEYVGDIPFLFLSIEDMNHSELRDITMQLAKEQPGFYFLTSNQNGRTLFYTYCPKQFHTVINISLFADWLKKKYGLKGGIGDDQIQGGGPPFDIHLKNNIIQWIRAQATS